MSPSAMLLYVPLTLVIFVVLACTREDRVPRILGRGLKYFAYMALSVLGGCVVVYILHKIL